jgi:hypothetical protein
MNGELMRIPNTLLPKLKQDLMIPQEKDFGAMSQEDKVYSCFAICPSVFSSSF